MNKKDLLGDRMKGYESSFDRKLMPLLPIVARIDGRCFSKFTKGMPVFYQPIMDSMVETARLLAEETNANIAYTQSDEITLVWANNSLKSQTWFNGKHSKMVSQLGALATIFFYKECLKNLPEYAHKNPTFDARVWQVPNEDEAVNAVLWREIDATRNSINSLAMKYFSYKELNKVSSSGKKDMLINLRNVNWNDLSPDKKRGTYIQKVSIENKMTQSEIDSLPPKHHARKNPDLVFLRSEFRKVDMPILSKVVNVRDVVLRGAAPQTLSEKV